MATAQNKVPRTIKEMMRDEKMKSKLEEISIESDDHSDDDSEYSSDEEVVLDIAELDLSDDLEAVERFFAAEDPDSEDPKELDYLEQRPITEVEPAVLFFEAMEDLPDLETIEKELYGYVSKPARAVQLSDGEEEEGEEEEEAEVPPAIDEPEVDADGEPVPEPEIQLDLADQTVEEAESEEDEAAEEEASEELSEESFTELFELDQKYGGPTVTKKVEYMDTDGLAALQIIIESEPVSKKHQQAQQAELEAQRILEEKLRLEGAVNQFLSDILGVIVYAAEQLAEKNRIASRIDKRRIIREIPRKQRELELERKHLYLLERRVIEHLKKKKQFRALTDGLSMEFPQEEQRYERNIRKLDHQLSLETESKRLIREQQARLKEELQQKRQEILEKVQFLEDTMRRIVTREDRHALRIAVNRSIALLAHEREALRKLRVVIIKKQDVVATLLQRIDDLEALGNGVMVADFERIRTKTLELSKKVEEREQDLYRMRFRFTSSLHTHAHLRERCAMVTKALLKDFASYDRINEFKMTLKKDLYNLKLNHLRIKKRINDLSYQCGLLDKDSLMREYDHTNDVVQEKRIRNKHLRKQLKDLQAKVDARYEELGISRQ